MIDLAGPSALEKNGGKFLAGGFDSALASLYGGDPRVLEGQRMRYRETLRAFAATYGGARDVSLYSVPGRVEICGNHTDHNNGLVVASAVDLDIVAAASPSGTDEIRISSLGFEDEFAVSIRDLEPRPEEAGTSTAMVRGVAAGMRERGATLGGFDAYVVSDVLEGSGLSSSAAFEVCVASVINGLFNGDAVPPVEVAILAQRAENRYFGKPSGLMDQIACAFGGIVAIDFENPALPLVSPIRFDLAAHGYRLVVTDTGGSHANLTHEYAAIRSEMERVAKFFGRQSLRAVEPASLLADVPRLRASVGDRAVLRALHFFGECGRVGRLRDAMEGGDMRAFLEIVRESGDSSFEYNQNAYCASTPAEQSIPLALAVSQATLGEAGAWRLQGGGFAGTIQAFVPEHFLAAYCESMQRVFGEGACRALRFRERGPCRVADTRDNTGER